MVSTIIVHALFIKVNFLEVSTEKLNCIVLGEFRFRGSFKFNLNVVCDLPTSHFLLNFLD